MGHVAAPEFAVLLAFDDDGIEQVGKRARDGDEHSEGFALVEAHGAVLVGKEPVHGEAELRPVRLDDAGQGLDAGFGAVNRAGHHEVDPRRRAEEAADAEGEDAGTEVADGARIGRIVEDKRMIASLLAPPFHVAVKPPMLRSSHP